MKVSYCEQGKQEWFDVRCGRITASEVGDALRKNLTGPLKGITSGDRENIMAFLAGEILTGMPDQMGYVSSYMERGTELEPDARRAYEREFGVMVEEVGFIFHPTIERSGSSPDGLIVGKHRGLEIKVPGIATHIKWMKEGVMPKQHVPQVQWNIDSAEYGEWDFISYCPTMPLGMQIFHKLVERDDSLISEMRDGVGEFLADTDRLVAKLREMYPAKVRNRPTEDFGEEGLTDDDLSDECFGAENVGKSKPTEEFFTTLKEISDASFNGWYERKMD